MEKNKSLLCVGGPLSGQRYATLGGTGFSVAVLAGDTGRADPMSREYQPTAPVEVVRRYYKEELFHTPQGDIAFWVPKEQTPFQTIVLLLAAFEDGYIARAERM